jgi:tetratricopeptide (TPR) repeat protein
MTGRIAASRAALAIILAGVFGAALPAAALAQSFEQIKQNCINTVGRPIVQACMGGRKDGPLEQCRAKATPAIRACVTREGERIAARKAAPAAPKENTSAAKDAGPVATTFVAPPRTISDITAILDNEKPDAAKIAERKAAADEAPPNSGSKSDLAQFYYDRANARALLGRHKDALADAIKALEVGKGGMDERQDTRIIQFVGLEHLLSGDPKQAIKVWQQAVRIAETQSMRRGALISASRGIAQALVSMGDISQADAIARRVVARVQEARGSPLPKWRATYRSYGNAWEADADAARALIFEARGQRAVNTARLSRPTADPRHSGARR